MHQRRSQTKVLREVIAEVHPDHRLTLQVRSRPTLQADVDGCTGREELLVQYLHLPSEVVDAVV